MATLMYYPRQEQLVSCNSQTNIRNLFKALGIEELAKTSSQPVIKSPEKYAGRTLEKHLQLYDWRNEFYAFERIIKSSPFDGICNSAVVSSRVSSAICFLNARLMLTFAFTNRLLDHQQQSANLTVHQTRHVRHATRSTSTRASIRRKWIVRTR